MMRWSSSQRTAAAARRFAADNSGATAVEYGLLLVLIIVAILASMSQLSGALNSMFGQLANFFNG